MGSSGMTTPSEAGAWFADHPVLCILGLSALLGGLQANRGPVGVLVGFLIGVSLFGGIRSVEWLALRRGGENAAQRARQAAPLVVLAVFAVITVVLFVVVPVVA
jgi:hypothetical protein